MKKSHIKFLIWIFFISFIISLDQIFKIYVLNNIYNSSKVLINGIINLTYVENTGGAFGVGKNNVMVFIVTNIIVIWLLMKYVLLKNEEINKYTLIATSFIIGGGVGNLIDRIYRGYVIDYIDLSPLIKYPVFNFADIFVVLGCCFLLIGLFMYKNTGECNERI